MSNSAAEAVFALAQSAEAELKGTLHEERIAAIRARLEGPLRVAIAGRV